MIPRRTLWGRGGYFELWRIAYPLIIMSAGNTVMQFVDRKFLASNSVADVAAAMPAGILYFTLFSFFMVTANFTSSLVAQYFGANDRRSLLGAVWTGLYFAIGASLLVVFGLPPLGAWIIRMGGHTPDLVARELEYFYALIPSGAFACMSAPLFSFFSGRGKTGPVAVINTVACLLNVPLNYAFIFGFGVIPPLGILGAGIATSLCSMFSFLAVLFWFLRYNQEEFPTRSVRDFRFEYLWKLLRYGTPAGLQTFFDVGAFTLITFLVGTLGELQLAAHVIALSINNMFFIPLLGLSDATSILSGQYIGKKRPDVSEAVVYRAWRMGLVYMCGGAIIYLFFPVALAEMFRPAEETPGFSQVVELTRWLLVSAVFFNFVDTVKFIFMGALRGAGDTRAVLFICSGCGYLLMVPGVFLLIKGLELSVIWVWCYLVMVALTESVLILRRYRSGKWRKIKLIDHHETDVPVESLENPQI